MKRSWLLTLVFCLFVYFVLQARAQGASILLEADADCTVFFDGEKVGELKEGEVTKILASLGDHLLEARTPDEKRRWKEKVKIDEDRQYLITTALREVQKGIGNKIAAAQKILREQETEKILREQETDTNCEQPSKEFYLQGDTIVYYSCSHYCWDTRNSAKVGDLDFSRIHLEVNTNLRGDSFVVIPCRADKECVKDESGNGVGAGTSKCILPYNVKSSTRASLTMDSVPDYAANKVMETLKGVP